MNNYLKDYLMHAGFRDESGEENDPYGRPIRDPSLKQKKAREFGYKKNRTATELVAKARALRPERIVLIKNGNKIEHGTLAEILKIIGGMSPKEFNRASYDVANY